MLKFVIETPKRYQRLQKLVVWDIMRLNRPKMLPVAPAKNGLVPWPRYGNFSIF